jgi:hypothetical protein
MLQKLSWFGIVGSLLMLFVFGFVHPLNAITQDLGRHVLLGKIIWQTHTIPSTNLFTYTYTDFPFINHHWLSEVLFYIISNAFGFPTLGGVMVLFAGTSIGVLIWYTYKKNLNPLAVGIVGILSLQILFERTDTRPEIFGWFILSLMLITLYSYREKCTKWIFLLPLLQLVWVNLHITFLVGIIVQGLFFLDLLFTYRRDIFHKHVKTFFCALLLSVGACTFNPHCITGALYPLTIFNNYGYSIEENQNILFLQTIESKLTILFFYISIFLLFISQALVYKKVRLIDWLISVLFAFLGFYAIRNFPLYAFIVFIPLTNALSTLFDTWTTHSFLFRKYGMYVLWTTTFGLLLFSLFHLYPAMNLSLTLPQGASNGVDFFERNNLKGPIFNNFDIGSYLEYRLYPKQKMFVDGRPEAFPEAFFQNTYIPMQTSPEIFERIDKQYHFQTIFFSHTDQTPWAQTFVESIVKNPQWKLVYLDPEVMILVKDDPTNAQMIREFSKPLETIPTLSYGTFQQNLRLTRFFSITNTSNRVVEYAKKLLEQNPNYCPAISVLVQIYTREQNAAANVYQYQYLQKCP